MLLSPPLIPNTIRTAIVLILYSHAVLVGDVPGGHPSLTGHVLVVQRPSMVHVTALDWGRWAELSHLTLGAGHICS